MAFKEGLSSLELVYQQYYKADNSANQVLNSDPEPQASHIATFRIECYHCHDNPFTVIVTTLSSSLLQFLSLFIKIWLILLLFFPSENVQLRL
jgi:hypothetical protein